MKNITLLMFIGIFLISVVPASLTTLGTFEQDIDITLVQTCGTCTFNNITSIVYPNSTHQILDTAMTKRGAEYIHNLADTELLGEYTVNGVGDINGVNTVWAYTFNVTSSGSDGVDSFWVLILILAISILLIIYGFIQEEHPPITMGAMIMLGLALYIWVNGIGALGNREILSQLVAFSLFLIGATLSIKSLQELK